MTDPRQKELETDTLEPQPKPGHESVAVRGNPEAKVTREPFERLVYQARTVKFWDLTDHEVAAVFGRSPGYYITLSRVSQEEIAKAAENQDANLIMPYKESFMPTIAENAIFSHYTPSFSFDLVDYSFQDEALIWTATPII